MLYVLYHGFFGEPMVDDAALTGMKATSGSFEKPLNPSGATPMIVYFDGPMAMVEPRTFLLPPNCVCQKAYDSTTTCEPSGGTSSASVKKRPITGFTENIFHKSAAPTPTFISLVASPVPTAM